MLHFIRSPVLWFESLVVLKRDSRRFFAAAATGTLAGPLTVSLGSSSFLTAIGLVAGLCLAVTMMIWPFWSLFITVLSVPIERIGRLSNDSSQVTFSVMRALGLLTLAALLVQTTLYRRRLRFGLPFALYGIYLIFAAISIAGSSDDFDGIRQLPAFLGNLLFFFLIPNLVTTRRHAHLLIAGWLCVSAAVGLFTIYGWQKGSAVTDSRFHSTGERSTDERFAVVLQDHAEFDLDEKIPRALGPTSHPAVYAINNIMTLPFYAWFMVYAAAPLWRWASGLGGVVAMYNVLLTNTRAALLTMLFVLLLVALTRIVRINWRYAALVPVLAIASIPMLPNALYERIFRAENYTASRSATLSARFLYWQAALDAIVEHPILGVGLGNQQEIPSRMKYIRTPPNSTAHCEYLFSLMEVGVIGYSFLVAFFVVLYRRCRATERVLLRRKDPATAGMLTATRVVFWGVLAYAIQVDCFHFPLKGWWLVMGISVALWQMARSESVPVQMSAEVPVAA